MEVIANLCGRATVGIGTVIETEKGIGIGTVIGIVTESGTVPAIEIATGTEIEIGKGTGTGTEIMGMVETITHVSEGTKATCMRTREVGEGIDAERVISIATQLEHNLRCWED